MTVRIDATDEHAVFLHKPEARSCLACACDDALVSIRSGEVEYAFRSARIGPYMLDRQGIQ